MAAPSYDVDLYDDAVLVDPYPHYRAIRDLGPAVWLPRNGMWAVGRFADVRAVLRDHGTFSSARGVAANDVLNGGPNGSTVTSDPPEHTHLRSLVRAPISPAALRDVAPRIEAEAEALVGRLVARGTFDAIADLARHLPVTVVSDLVGLPPEGHANMLRWASATFDALGPMNERGRAALPHVEEARTYCAHAGTLAALRPGGWAAAIRDAGERGEIAPERCPVLLRDYVSPSLDTTILATGSLLHLLARHPEQWERLRADPALVPHAINEAVRLESPIRGFTRHVTRDHDLGGVPLREGDRVLVLYASANRDERRWDDPERFDVTRNVRDHLGFGFGLHVCVGMHLARLEMTALLTALLRRVRRLEAGRPTWTMNNVLRGLEALPMTVH